MKPYAKTLCLMTMTLLPAAPLSAHDFWIAPWTFRPAVGELVRVSLRVGEDFKGEPVLRDPERIKRFSLIGSQGEKPIIGMDARDPAGLLRPAAAGLAWITYQSTPGHVELDAKRFEVYLKSEGLEKIVELREQRHQSDKPGRERFLRHAKSLLCVGGSSAGDFAQALGLQLELVPEKNPYALHPGDSLPVQLLFDGKPLADALVTAMPRDKPGEKVTARTDRDGRVQLHLTRPGVWLIAAVNMVPVATGADADWESTWASLTFELSSSPATAPAAARE